MKNLWIGAMMALALAGAKAASAGGPEDVGHSYQLKTGDRIYFSQQGRQRLFVQLDGQKRERMHAQPDGTFRTESGALVEFSPWGHTVTIRHFELLSPALARQGLRDITLASQ